MPGRKVDVADWVILPLVARIGLELQRPPEIGDVEVGVVDDLKAGGGWRSQQHGGASAEWLDVLCWPAKPFPHVIGHTPLTPKVWERGELVFLLYRCHGLKWTFPFISAIPRMNRSTWTLFWPAKLVFDGELLRAIIWGGI